MCVLQYWTHILTCFIMTGVKPYNIENSVMSEYCGRCFLPHLLADCFVYCSIFLAHIYNGRCVCYMSWLMLLPYMNVMADVYAIVDNIGCHLVVLKKADVIALHLYLWQMLLPWWLMELPLVCFKCRQMLLP